MMKNSKEWAKEFDNVNFVEFIDKIQKDAYNQAIEDSKLRIKYEPYCVVVNIPTDNANYTNRNEDEIIDFLMSYEESVEKLKIK
jgi:hypothetical protein